MPKPEVHVGGNMEFNIPAFQDGIQYVVLTNTHAVTIPFKSGEKVTIEFMVTHLQYDPPQEKE